MRNTLILLMTLSLSCQAAFSDDGTEPDPQVISDTDDAGSTTGSGDGNTTGTSGTDAGATDPDAGGETGTDAGESGGDDMPVAAGDTVVAAGMFQASPSYGGQGTAELVQLEDGSWEVRLSEDFEVGGVPGPVVVLAREESLGATLDPARGDMELGVLESNSGAQTYAVPEDPGDRRVVWVYCKPFGVEVSHAPLTDL